MGFLSNGISKGNRAFVQDVPCDTDTIQDRVWDTYQIVSSTLPKQLLIITVLEPRSTVPAGRLKRFQGKNEQWLQ